MPVENVQVCRCIKGTETGNIYCTEDKQETCHKGRDAVLNRDLTYHNYKCDRSFL